MFRQMPDRNYAFRSETGESKSNHHIFYLYDRQSKYVSLLQFCSNSLFNCAHSNSISSSAIGSMIADFFVVDTNGNSFRNFSKYWCFQFNVYFWSISIDFLGSNLDLALYINLIICFSKRKACQSKPRQFHPVCLFPFFLSYERAFSSLFRI